MKPRDLENCSSDNNSENDWVRIGEIVSCQGLKGDLKVNPVDKQAEWPSLIDFVYLGNPEENKAIQKKVTSCRWQKNIVVIRLEGIDDRNAAEPFRNTPLYVLRKMLPELTEGEYWADDLIGLNVLDEGSGELLGVVVDFVSAGTQDFLEIKPDDRFPSQNIQTIPFNEHFIPKVNLLAGEIFLKGLNSLFD